MEFVDDLIVVLAMRVLHGLMIIGTGLVYVQFFALVVFLLMAGAGMAVLVVVDLNHPFLGG